MSKGKAALKAAAAAAPLSMADRDGWIWHDGKLVEWRSATTHVLTHSLHYGLAVFEGVRAYKTAIGTAIFRLKEHTDRLFSSAHIYMMKIPYTRERLMQAQLDVVQANGHDACYIRPVVYRGVGELGVLADAERRVDGQERDQAVFEPRAFGGGGRAGQDLQPGIDLERVGGHGDRAAAGGAQPVGELQRDLRLADPGRPEEEQHAVRPIEAILERAFVQHQTMGDGADCVLLADHTPLYALLDVLEPVGHVAEDHVLRDLGRV